MISAEHTQSLSDFKKTASATINRLNQTGEAEIITVNGEARAVLLTPGAYDDLARAREAEIERDVAAIRRAMKQIDESNWITADDLHQRLRGELLAMKASQGTKK